MAPVATAAAAAQASRAQTEEEEADSELIRMAAQIDGDGASDGEGANGTDAPKTAAETEEKRRGRPSKAQQAQEEEDPAETAARFKKLKYLLKKSGVYAKIMQEKMDREAEKRRTAETKTAAADKRAADSTEATAEHARPAAGRTTRAGEAGEKPEASATARRQRAPDKRKRGAGGYAITDYIGEEDLHAAGEQAEEDGPARKKAKDANGKAAPAHKGEALERDERQPELVTGAIMRSYQITGLEWLVSLYENGLNGILADEMGLGKTLQTISFFAYLKKRNVWGPFLVVAPKSTIRNWRREFEKFTPTIPVLEYMGPKPSRRKLFDKHLRAPQIASERHAFPIVLTSFEAVITDRPLLARHKWKFIVVDEGHRLKNFNCLLINELKKFNSANRLILSGTPLQNNLKELWSLLNFILPDIFDDLATFEQWFNFDAVREEGGSSSLLSSDSQQALITQLHEILKPFLLRRLKVDVENLPPKKEYLLYAPLSQMQKELYDSFVDKSFRRRLLELHTGLSFDEMAEVDEDVVRWADDRAGKAVKADTPTAQDSVDDNLSVSQRSRKRTRQAKKDVDYGDETEAAFTRRVEQGGDSPGAEVVLRPRTAAELKLESRKALIREARKQVDLGKYSNITMALRRTCCHPYLFHWPKDADGEPEIGSKLVAASGKMLMLNRLLDALLPRGHKVLIFSQFKTVLDVLHTWAIEHKGLEPFRIDGDSTADERDEQMQKFNNGDKCNLFLLTTRAGGLGINLVAADTVIFFDSDWNPQADLQAQDRAHRIGQKKPVLVFRLVAGNTFEQRLLKAATAKRELEKIVVADDKFLGVSESSVAGLRKKAKAATLVDSIRKLEAEKVQLAVEGDEIISDANLEKLLDRSEAAMQRQRGWVSDRSGNELTSDNADGAQMAFEVTERTDEEADPTMRALFGADDTGVGDLA